MDKEATKAKIGWELLPLIEKGAPANKPDSEALRKKMQQVAERMELQSCPGAMEVIE